MSRSPRTLDRFVVTIVHNVDGELLRGANRSHCGAGELEGAGVVVTLMPPHPIHRA